MFHRHLYSNSEHKNGDSMILSIWDVQASNREPAVTAAETVNQRSLGNNNTPEKHRTKNESDTPQSNSPYSTVSLAGLAGTVKSP